MPIIGGRQIGVRGLGFQGAGKPSVPTSVSATDVGTGRAFNNGAADVTWVAPSSNGAPITSYTVLSSPGGYSATTSSTSVQVTGLQSSTSYTFTVTATNAVGTSDASSASSSITATTVPQAPTIGTATVPEVTQAIDVAYTAGATGGKAVTYTATSSPGSLTGTGASPIRVSGLTNGTSYTFTVTATNANGTSTASSASNSVIPVVPTSFESIATATGTGSSGTLTFSSIPSTYKHLQIRYTGRSSRAVTQNDMDITFNSDTGANYAAHDLNGNGSSVSASGTASTTRIRIPNSTTGSQTAANVMGVGIIDIQDYSSNSKNKTLRATTGVDSNGGSSSVFLSSGLWSSTNPITSISFSSPSGNFETSSVFSLYGIKG